MLAKITNEELTSEFLFDKAIRQGMMIRDCSTFPFLDNKYIRFCFMKPEDRVLDMCTGSGCILISLACYKNEIEGVGIDLSEEALTVARKNADTLFAGHSGQLTFLKSDLYDVLPESELFDVIVSNPPYIRSDVIETLETEVKEHDPYMALDGGVSGLDFYEQITAKAPDYLRAGGYLLYEIGFDQGEDVKKLMESHGFADVTIIKDLAGNDRVVKGRKRCLTN